jgi:patatin-like phospholipase/acyl hydrolase
MVESKDDSTSPALLRVLTLDGGGAKGFYTLGVLKEIEAMVGCLRTRRRWSNNLWPRPKAA